MSFEAAPRRPRVVRPTYVEVIDHSPRVQDGTPGWVLPVVIIGICALVVVSIGAMGFATLALAGRGALDGTQWSEKPPADPTLEEDRGRIVARGEPALVPAAAEIDLDRPDGGRHAQPAAGAAAAQRQQVRDRVLPFDVDDLSKPEQMLFGRLKHFPLAEVPLDEVAVISFDGDMSAYFEACDRLMTLYPEQGHRGPRGVVLTGVTSWEALKLQLRELGQILTEEKERRRLVVIPRPELARARGGLPLVPIANGDDLTGIQPAAPSDEDVSIWAGNGPNGGEDRYVNFKVRVEMFYYPASERVVIQFFDRDMKPLPLRLKRVELSNWSRDAFGNLHRTGFDGEHDVVRLDAKPEIGEKRGYCSRWEGQVARSRLEGSRGLRYLHIEDVYGEIEQVFLPLTP